MKLLLANLWEITRIGIALTYDILVNGFAIFKFFYWFIIPVFTTLPHISYIQSLGLAIVIDFLRGPQDTVLEELNGSAIEKEPNWVALVIYPWLILLTGWVFHLFIK